MYIDALVFGEGVTVFQSKTLRHEYIYIYTYPMTDEECAPYTDHVSVDLVLHGGLGACGEVAKGQIPRFDRSSLSPK